MESIRVSSGIKEIEVNDQGETIRLPLSDDSFIKGFYELLEFVKQRATVVSESDASDALDTIEAACKFDEEVRDKVDTLMGENTCKKVFGNVLPSSDQFIELMMQLSPIIENHTQKRVANMNKYSAGRVGSV